MQLRIIRITEYIIPTRDCIIPTAELLAPADVGMMQTLSGMMQEQVLGRHSTVPAQHPARSSCRLTAVQPHFFATPEDFRRWLAEHHASARELWVGFYKRGTGKPSITWPESVDEALCAGWIDGIRKRIDDESYVIRFTPRKASSTWSAVNIKRMAELIREGRVLPAGLTAFEKRSEKKSGIYSYEQRNEAALGEELEQKFREHKAAWEYFQAQPPWYRRTATYWVVSAKKEETRQRRLAVLIEASAQEQPIRELKRPGKAE
ncbi:MAG TPA: YdeI/OmpD-associated family protein [Thermoanaerobaculia bacterium]|nr:YdeI/OmpD-associated family protein [Thermoanaerobaculia bacterium]